MKKILATGALLLSVTNSFAVEPQIETKELRITNVNFTHKLHVRKTRGVIAGKWTIRGGIALEGAYADHEFLGTVSCAKDALRCNYSIDAISPDGTLKPSIITGRAYSSYKGFASNSRKWGNLTSSHELNNNKEELIPTNNKTGSYLKVDPSGAELYIAVNPQNNGNAKYLKLSTGFWKYDGAVDIRRVEVGNKNLKIIGNNTLKGQFSFLEEDSVNSIACFSRFESLNPWCFLDNRQIDGEDLTLGLLSGRAEPNTVVKENGEPGSINFRLFDENGFNLNNNVNVDLK